MASIRQEGNSWHVYFRWGGKQYHKCVGPADGKTRQERDNQKRFAERELGRIETVLDELDRHRKELPPGGDIWEFVRSDGKRAEKPTATAVLTLGAMLDAYFEKLPPGSKEENTLSTERIHARHLKREFGTSKPLSAIGWAQLQEYVNKRSGTVGRQTVMKELATLRMVWRRTDNPVPYPQPKDRGASLVFPKGKQKAPFEPYDVIAARVERDGLTGEEARALWESVFLSVEQVNEVLGYARGRRTTNGYWIPLLVFVAHTGCRRSEAARSRLDDLRFDTRDVVIREKKKDTSVSETTRMVPMSPRLERTLREWLTVHPGGPFTFCIQAGTGLNVKSLNESWDWFFRDRADADPKWAVLPGYHVFRHSFASNLARNAVDQRSIDALMGHETEAMRRRYRHLFPETRRHAIDVLFGTTEGV